MKSAQILLYFLILGFFLQSCQQDACLTKDQFISSFETFVEEVEKMDDELSKVEKEAFEERYRAIVDNCYKKFKDDMDLKERQEFWKSSLQYYVAKEGGSINLVLNKEKDDAFNAYIGDEIEELIKESGDEFASAIEDVIKSEVPKLIDTVVNELEKMGDELKKALED